MLSEGIKEEPNEKIHYTILWFDRLQFLVVVGKDPPQILCTKSECCYLLATTLSQIPSTQWRTQCQWTYLFSFWMSQMTRAIPQPSYKEVHRYTSEVSSYKVKFVNGVDELAVFTWKTCGRNCFHRATVWTLNRAWRTKAIGFSKVLLYGRFGLDR